jgi:hypothetical protein
VTDIASGTHYETSVVARWFGTGQQVMVADVEATLAGDEMNMAQHPFWLDEPCPDWCDGYHDDRDLPADRRHVSGSQGGVRLTQAEAVEAADGQWVPQEIHLVLAQHVREIEPLVLFRTRATATVWHLTLNEARDLAEALTRALSVCG